MAWRTAQKLSEYGVLVLMGEVPPRYHRQTAKLVKEWVDAYADIYLHLTRALFPTYTGFTAYYADQSLPIVVIMEGQCVPVLYNFATCLVPFVAMRQDEPIISEAELRGVMTILMDELEAGDLPQRHYAHLCREGIDPIKQLLLSPIHQVALTDFARPLFDTTSSVQAILYPPQTLPETRPQSIIQMPLQKVNGRDRQQTREQFPLVVQVPNNHR